ncbi:MAG: ABC transporter ATP-binding protein [Chloroflexi bacterium]|nr:ABC transporter ATP-binding protein [Chloroflexota bacterium]
MVICTHGLTKYYGKIRGIEGLDLEVRAGEIFGFLGSNGAGKTTTIRLLLGLLRPSHGQAEIFGLDVERRSPQIRRQIGYIPGDVSFYEGLSGEEMLNLLGRLHPSPSVRRRRELAERLELDMGRKIKTYSRGMKQKLAIVQALMNDPRLLILDEPTLGLDPLMQREFYKILAEERAGGKTVFLSSHVLPEVERVCDRLGIVRDGRLVTVEDVAQLKRKKVRHMELIFKGEVSAEALDMEGVEILHREGNRMLLAVHGNVEGLLRRLAELPVEDMVFPEATLEDTFMKFYSQEARR